VRCDRIETMRQDYPISVLCRVFELGSSSYYAWRRRLDSPRARENARLEIEIAAAHERTRQTYGRERLQADLLDHGVSVGLHRIRRIRTKLGLRCKQKRKFRNTTDSKHDLPVAPNLLERNFDMSMPNQAWVSDITYVWTDEGWLYLAGIKDLFNGELVGYAMSERMTRTLVMQALFAAVALKRPAAGLILHSDRGSQYCSHDYRDLAKQFGMTMSMSRKGDCYDNAPMESFWGSLKTELVHHRRFTTRAEARQAITEYIEIFYNRQRKQARLDYLSPAAFMQRFYKTRLAA
jgi:putative transposase